MRLTVSSTALTRGSHWRIKKNRHHPPFLTVYKQFRNDAFDTDTHNLIRGARVGNACPSRVQYIKPAPYTTTRSRIYSVDQKRLHGTLITRHAGHAEHSRTVYRKRRQWPTRLPIGAMTNTPPIRASNSRAILIVRDINFLQR